MTDRNVTDRNVTDRNVTDRNVTGRNVTGRNVTGRNVTGRNLTVRNLTVRNLTVRNLTGGTPGAARASAAHGQLGYLQLPARDLAGSAAFYQGVFGWTAELEFGSFQAPGLIGQWTTDLTAAPASGPVLWLCVDNFWAALNRVVELGGAVHAPPVLDQGERWLVELDDPAGNRIGLVALAQPPAAQPLIAVRDVEASSHWYQHLLGLTSDHGGPHYERLLAGGTLALQLHKHDVEHHHGPVLDAPDQPVGNGLRLWFGEVSDFDAVVERAAELGATVVRPPHRNPPVTDGNGPSHREIWIRDPDGCVLVVASPDGEAWLNMTDI